VKTVDLELEPVLVPQQSLGGVETQSLNLEGFLRSLGTQRSSTFFGNQDINGNPERQGERETRSHSSDGNWLELKILDLQFNTSFLRTLSGTPGEGVEVVQTGNHTPLPAVPKRERGGELDCFNIPQEGVKVPPFLVPTDAEASSNEISLSILSLLGPEASQGWWSPDTHLSKMKKRLITIPHLFGTCRLGWRGACQTLPHPSREVLEELPEKGGENREFRT
jgi:hypothetical protein